MSGFLKTLNTISGPVTFNDTVTIDGYTSIDDNLAVTGQIIGASPLTLTPSGTTATIDWDDGNAQIIDLSDASGDVTLSFAAGSAHPGTSYLLTIIQDVAVARDLIYPSSVIWSSGVVPTISAGSLARDLLSFYYDGEYYYGNISQNFS